MDLWLGRTYLEGGGGGNEGESYSLAHYFAAHHTVTDAWQKRGQKGLLITIGDEPSLKSYPTRAIKEVMGTAAMQAVGFTDQEALEAAQKQWEVYHINPRDDGSESRNRWRDAKGYWSQLLGQNYIGTGNYEEIPKLVTDLIIKHGTIAASANDVPVDTTTDHIHDGTIPPDTTEIL